MKKRARRAPSTISSVFVMRRASHTPKRKRLFPVWRRAEGKFAAAIILAVQPVARGYPYGIGIAVPLLEVVRQPFHARLFACLLPYLVDERAIFVRTDGERRRKIFKAVSLCMLRRRAEAQLKALAAPHAALGRALEPLCGAQKHVVVISATTQPISGCASARYRLSSSARLRYSSLGKMLGLK